MGNTKNQPANSIDHAIAARYPVIYVVTWEEERLEALLTHTSKKLFSDDRPVRIWTAARGFINGPGSKLKLTDPIAALQFAITDPADAIYLMKDLPAHFESNPTLLRSVRDAYDAFSMRPGSIILSHPTAIVPPMLTKEIYLLELPLPRPLELRHFLQRLLAETPLESKLSAGWLDQVANAMRGLTANQARDLVRQMISESALEISQALVWIQRARAQVLMKEDCLEVIPEKLDLRQIGGLEKLKTWTLNRRQLFSKEAREANIKAPSGILIMGVSGCGKSLAAKTIPSVWGLPLIRLDMNLIMSGGWGTPEVAWERALRTIESAAPVVLWIDELENSFGFLNDSITSGNMTIFSSFLTWMQEKPDNVFVAATANKIEILPAEMLRKGRFDQLFFVDLPDTKSRIEILRIHLRNQGFDPDSFRLDHIARLVDGWSAAEIEQMIRSAQIDAFTHNKDMTEDIIILNIYNIVPLSKTMAKQINALRIWAQDRAAPAN